MFVSIIRLLQHYVSIIMLFVFISIIFFPLFSYHYIFSIIFLLSIIVLFADLNVGLFRFLPLFFTFSMLLIFSPHSSWQTTSSSGNIRVFLNVFFHVHIFNTFIYNTEPLTFFLYILSVLLLRSSEERDFFFLPIFFPPWVTSFHVNRN